MEDRCKGARQPRVTAKGTVKAALAMPPAMAAGALLHIFLARALQPDLYGLFAVVTSVVVWAELSGQSLFREATARAVAQAGAKWQRVAGTSVRATLMCSAGIMVACMVAAPSVAAALRDPSLTPYLRLLALDIPPYLLWGLHLSVLNGRRLYGRAALSSVAYWVAKLLLICGLVQLGLSVRGAILGSIGASVVGLAAAWIFNGIGLARGTHPASQLIMFGLPLVGLAVASQLIFAMDLWFVKALVDRAAAAGQYAVARQAYHAALQLPLCVTVAMFPTLTKAITRSDRGAITELITEAGRFVVIIATPMIAIMGCAGRETLSLLLGDEYAPAAGPLVVLLVGTLGFGMRYVGNTVLIAAGKPSTALMAFAPMLPLNIALNLALVPRYGLVGAATATATTGAVAAAVMLWLTWRQFRVLVSPLVLVRTLIAAGVVYGIGLLVPAPGALVLVKLAGLSGLYLLMLAGLGELKKRDLEPLLFWRGAVGEGVTAK